ncbi:MAG: hypothetical protein IJ874_02480 [Ruminococcus sp.]|nr:hypothetical protein [Ruminococcus sp.]
MNDRTDTIKNPGSVSPDELAELIDRLMAEGSGHVNIDSSTDESDALRVETVKSTDCTGKQGACCQPTEDEIDPDED